MLDLPNVMHRLAKSRPIFHSETDFQHALAWQLHIEHQDARIRLEYRPFPNERVYIDIWCELNGLSTAIELKYPTKRTSITSQENERFELANHGAQDVTRYDIVKDIVRIERAMDTAPNTAAAAIVLTNDPSFWNASPRATPTIDDAFRIHDGRTLAGSCAWAISAGPGTIKGRTAILDVRGTYPMIWQDYSSLNERWGQFRFVIIEPKPAMSITVMTALACLTPAQQAIVRAWLPDAGLVADLSWELMGTAVLHLRAPEGDRIVKAGRPENHHIGREITAHSDFTRPWVTQERTARMLEFDLDTNMLLLEYLPGELVQGHTAEADPDTYRQGGAMLAEFHGQACRQDDDYEARMTSKALVSLDSSHRIAPETVARLRELLLAADPKPVMLVPTHGDWQPRNWLIDDGIVRAIDFGRFDWRPALTDFARLAVRQFAANSALEAAFLDGYGSDPRTPALWRPLLIREAIGTAVWAYQVGDERFEQEGHRMIEDVLRG